MKKEEMMKQIQSYNFAVIELAQYLNTHPNDRNALELYNKYSKELEELREKYQKMFGPLTIYYPNQNEWKWIEGPWPWEGGRS